jgi:hypothetical protein
MAEFVTLRDSPLEDQGQQPRAVADVGREQAGKGNERTHLGDARRNDTCRHESLRILHVGAGLW